MVINETEIAGTQETVDQVKLAAKRSLNRRNFMTALTVAGAASAAMVAGRSSSTPSTVHAAPAGPSQIDVLNFALNLEYLEATFYSYITQGADLPPSATIGSGAITGAPAAKLVFTGPNAAQITDLLNEIYFDELSHVLDLRSVLGSLAVNRPALNLAAGGTITASNALGLSRVFEDVGVTAYTGAAALLSGTNLTYAAQILAVEGFHAGALRLTLLQNLAFAYDIPTVGASGTFTATSTAGSAVLTNVYFINYVGPAGILVTGPGINGGLNGVNAATTAFTNTAITGTVAVGSTTVTAVSSVAGLAIGQTITAAGIPANTTITAFSATALTITLSAAATAAGTKIAVTVGTGTVTLNLPVSVTQAGGTYTVGFLDINTDVLPYDPGSVALATAGPTYSGAFFATSGGVTANGLTPAGLAFTRTTSQVLSIVYATNSIAAAATTAKGGFFPNGMNGLIYIV